MSQDESRIYFISIFFNQEYFTRHEEPHGPADRQRAPFQAFREVAVRCSTSEVETRNWWQKCTEHKRETFAAACREQSASINLKLHNFLQREWTQSDVRFHICQSTFQNTFGVTLKNIRGWSPGNMFDAEGDGAETTWLKEDFHWAILTSRQAHNHQERCSHTHYLTQIIYLYRSGVHNISISQAW